MSAAGRTDRSVEVPMVEGQRLDRAEFHARYESMPSGIRAELIDGVVSMPSPAGAGHGRVHSTISYWLLCYREGTPDVDVLDNATTFLGPRSEVQPDAQMRILPECGGRTTPAGRYIAGGPELVVEVSQATQRGDLGSKRIEYERAGVLEDVVIAAEPDEVIWHRLRDGRLEAVPADGDGLYRSTAFPGLWLDPSAMLACDLRGLRAALERGLATPEHGAFVARLNEVRDRR